VSRPVLIAVVSPINTIVMKTSRFISILAMGLSLSSCGLAQVPDSAGQQGSVTDSAYAAAPCRPTALDSSICASHPHALKGITILLDAGHGGEQLGAHFDSVQEKRVNLAVACKLKTRLEAMGATVYMTRVRDDDISLSARVQESIRLKPDIFVSVHSNANFKRDIDGIETYYYSARSRELASTLLSSVSNGLNEKANWVEQERLFVVHHNVVPSVLVEIGYLSNLRTRALLITDEYQERAAESIAVGIFNYFSEDKAARGCNLSRTQIASIESAMKKAEALRNRHFRPSHKKIRRR